jgi:hypothetical protein
MIGPERKNAMKKIALTRLVALAVISAFLLNCAAPVLYAAAGPAGNDQKKTITADSGKDYKTPAEAVGNEKKNIRVFQVLKPPKPGESPTTYPRGYKPSPKAILVNPLTIEELISYIRAEIQAGRIDLNQSNRRKP